MFDEDEITQAELNGLWLAGDLSWLLWAQQFPIYQSIRSLKIDVPIIVILCARQFGKSFLGCILAIEDCLRFKDTCTLIVGPTIKQTIDIVAPRIKIIAKTAPEGLIKRTKYNHRWLIGESELVIGGFDQDSTSQRGKALHNIYIEEVVDSDPDQYTESMRSDLGPALTHSKSGKMFFLTTPPKIPDHPFIVDTMTEARLSNSFFQYTIDDNIVLTKEQRDRCAKLAGGIHSIDYRREYKCEIVRDPSVLIVPDFNEEKHIKDFILPLYNKYQITIDWGGARDKTCVLLHSYDFHQDLLLILDELVFEPNTSTDIIYNAIIEFEKIVEKIELRTVDAPSQVIIDLNTIYNYEVSVPNKADWQANINSLSTAFFNNKILIKPKCKFLIESCRSGTFNKQRTDFARTRALGHCDGIATLMYANREQMRERPWVETQFSNNSFQGRRKDSTLLSLAKLIQGKTWRK